MPAPTVAPDSLSTSRKPPVSRFVLNGSNGSARSSCRLQTPISFCASVVAAFRSSVLRLILYLSGLMDAFALAAPMRSA